MNVLNFGRARLARVVALCLLLGALGFAALAPTLANTTDANIVWVCVEYNDSGTCVSWRTVQPSRP